MSLSYEKLNDKSLAIAIDLETSEIIWYNKDDNSDCESLEDDCEDVELDEEDLLALDKMLDDYKSIKYKEPYIKKFKKKIKELENQKVTKIKGNNFFPLPLYNREECQISHLVISAQQGCGKSYFASQYIELYNLKFPNNDIYIISKKDKDEAFDKFNFIKRIKLEDFLECELNTGDLSNALVVFDDIEQISDKEIKKKVYQLKDDLSETGRSSQIYIISINHLPLSGKSTKTDNNELTAAVVFPASTKYHSRNLLEKYVGISKEDTNKILNINTRWVYINKNIPTYIITKKRVQLI
jgi:hypothetical protein